jgi:hypothetical protein
MQIYNDKVRKTEDFKNILGLMDKFDKIEEKNRCLRVRFLDWLSAKLSNWSVRVKKVSDNIDSPCVIKVGDKPASWMPNRVNVKLKGSK